MNDNKLTNKNSPLEETKLIISVKEAHKILGRKSKSLDDDQVKRLISALTDISENILQN